MTALTFRIRYRTAAYNRWYTRFPSPSLTDHPSKASTFTYETAARIRLLISRENPKAAVTLEKAS